MTSVDVPLDQGWGLETEISNELDLCQFIPHTFEGEGSHVGVPVTMIRFSKCNLACPWCDSDGMMKAGPSGLAAPVTLKSILEAAWKTRTLMFTGGEPFTVPMNRHSAMRIVKFVMDSPARWLEINVIFETNGVKTNDAMFIDLHNIEALVGMGRVKIVWSPKFLDYMTDEQCLETPLDFAERLVDSGVDFCIKPVAPFGPREREFFNALWMWPDFDKVLRDRIYFMPMGETREELLQSTPGTLDLCREYGVRFGPRVHIMHEFP